MMWETWMFGLVAAFIVVLVYYTFTPFISVIYNDVYAIGNFSHTETNSSFHNTIDYNQNMWNLWPIVAFAIIFLVLFYMTSEERKYGDLY